MERPGGYRLLRKGTRRRRLGYNGGRCRSSGGRRNDGSWSSHGFRLSFFFIERIAQHRLFDFRPVQVAILAEQNPFERRNPTGKLPF